MPIEIKLPEEIELKVKTDKEIKKILMKRIEKDISEEIKGDIFLSMLFDEILEESKLTQNDVAKIDHKVKKGIMENLEWK